MLKWVITVVVAFIAFQVSVRVFSKMFRSAAPAWIAPILDTRWRRRVQPPVRLIGRSGVGAGMAVLEVGCGNGAFTPFIARRVNGGGVVCAYDLQLAMLERLQRKLGKPVHRDIDNVLAVNGDACALPFADGSFDLVLLAAVLQEIPDRAAALREARRVLREGGICSVSEFLPDPDYPLKRTTVALLERAGFTVEAISGGIFDYTVRAVKGLCAHQ